VFLYTDGLLENARSPRRLQLHHLSRLLTTQDPLEAIQKRLEDLTGPEATTMDDDCSFILCRLQSA
ncbi:MAG: serine/threonine-protein phosphatase, partial [Pseudobdellovibrionaceae bacterium]|nr:serine/threonine-protein phosphatase [Pseudobdellovibrionaceae bacterium]